MAVKGGRVSVISEKVRLPLSKRNIERLADKVLSILGQKDGKVCIFFVNDRKMRELNLRYRKIDRPTDCLAFPMYEGGILGDIVISVDTAGRNSEYFGSSVKKEITLYLIHGILHLLGFKDTTAPARKRMKRMEEGLLRRL